MKTIDLRSDTVTKPSKAMLEAMLHAEVGDDVYGEDPTVNKLQAIIAERASKEAALFVPSGTQSNLLGIMSHCERGDEYIVGQKAHTYLWEGGGAAVLGSIQPQPLDFETDGSLCLDKVDMAIKPLDDHYARTRLLCLENTTAGKVLPLSYLNEVRVFCQSRGLFSHLDGARVFNAAVKLNVELHTISQNFDSISICLSKGLGAPIGSVLCGTKEFINKARRWRKVLGGGMRQAGIMAAAGIFALENNVDRLKDDHEHAQALASGLAEIAEIEVDIGALQTNIVLIKAPNHYAGLWEHLQQQGIIFPRHPNKANIIRLATHLDISGMDINRTIQEIKKYYYLTK
ncbi:low-specificity L-threonine aldolase [Legionella maioricensis]|uniref:Low-specificity L-threonine aldolase n=1 Tax=Legionella maioricensis TaxID=2896528 RepID=A0A9X2D153_9GAMM|nr:low-specificity L-threonine aldolase [Legionella maioricensis]MCL9684551.1 low-specificity L-threonine aldolase [Legionella maioricensis]MCL9687855.1 low-specificity L-threonine aldolase [Legionella maioricensis]